MPLFHVQDPDRPAFVIADDWNHAIQKWEAALESELDECDRDGQFDPPNGIQFVCGDDELIVGSGFWSETVDINARNPKTPVDGCLQSMYVTLASIRERLCALGRSKHIQLQSDEVLETCREG